MTLSHRYQATPRAVVDTCNLSTQEPEAGGWGDLHLRDCVPTLPLSVGHSLPLFATLWAMSWTQKTVCDLFVLTQ